MPRPFRLLLVALILVLGPPALAQPGDVRIARVQYGGGGDWYSDEGSLEQLAAFVRQHTLVDVNAEEAVVELTSDGLFQYPYLYLTGHGNVHFSDDEAARLRRYLDGGGFLHIDDNYGLDEAIRREMEKVYPGQAFRALPSDHPVYRAHFRLDGLPKIHEHDGEPAQGFGLFDDEGRLVVFYSYQSDLGDGWEPAAVHDNPPEVREAALQMGANLVVYALTH